MKMHVEALYTHDGHSRIERINEKDGGIAPRFFLGRTAEGKLWRIRSDLPVNLAMSLAELGDSESEAIHLSKTPQHQQQYIRALESDAPIEQVWTGPVYWLPEDIAPRVQPVEITEENADLLRGGLEDWLPDVSHRYPFMAIVEDDRAVSVCSSIRITDVAHEAGVETLPPYRGKGHAVNVVAGWAIAVRQMGAIPLYSTSWDNVASQNVAASLSSSMFGVDFHIT